VSLSAKDASFLSKRIGHGQLTDEAYVVKISFLINADRCLLQGFTRRNDH